ncbi:MAG: hypothetical protein O7D91_21370 [Planctomycetota bacterium]|nr:hypothetical protein [Planctomycetota bacterium]
MAATENVITQRQEDMRIGVPVSGGIKIFGGSMVFIGADGFATNVETAGTTPFAGIADNEVDNIAGADGDKFIDVVDGIWSHLDGSSFTQADVGVDLFATDDNTLTATSTSNTFVGRVVEFRSATRVAWRSAGLASGVIGP